MSRSPLINSEAIEIHIDSHTGSISIENNMHSQAHSGNAYNLSHIFAAITTGNSAEIMAVIPANILVHPEFEFTSDGDVEVSIVKVATGSAGVAVNSRNINSSSSNTADTTFSHTPTGLATETQIIPPRKFYAAGIGAATSLLIKTTEPVLDEGKHVFRVKNVSGTNSEINIIITFYEEPL